jgi:hypothetical protein
MKCLAIHARCQILGDESVIDQTRRLLNHIEALVVGQLPLGYNLAKFVDGVLLDETQRSKDGPGNCRTTFLGRMSCHPQETSSISMLVKRVSLWTAD